MLSLSLTRFCVVCLFFPCSSPSLCQEDEPLLIEDVDPPKLPSEPEKDATKSRGPITKTRRDARQMRQRFQSAVFFFSGVFVSKTCLDRFFWLGNVCFVDVARLRR